MISKFRSLSLNEKSDYFLPLIVKKPKTKRHVILFMKYSTVGNTTY